jgi:alpha-mannosidase
VDPVPARGQANFSYEYGGTGIAVGGPVMAEMRVTSPFGDGEFGIRIRVYAGMPRVEIETELINRLPFVRYRNVFPFNLHNPVIAYEIPFGAIERPEGEYPAQNWVDVSDGERGVALLNQGIPGHSLVGNVLTSSLLKCVKVVRYSGGGYSKEEKDTAGFEIGVTHRFKQALLPHRGNWQTARLYKEGLAFNVPLIVRKVTSHPGDLPARNSFFAIEPDNLILHAMYVEGDQLVLRVAEAAGKAVEGKIALNWPISSAVETDLIGTAIETLKTGRTDLDVSATPFEIKTFKIRLSNG